MPRPEIPGQTCPLCLSVDDPAGMLEVAIERTYPPDAAVVVLCGRCARAITKATIDLDLMLEAKEEHAEDATTQRTDSELGIPGQPGADADQPGSLAPDTASESRARGGRKTRTGA